mmetsp:Transcript_21517/g.9969  ORF Transcript_21517/g.9969 Transcript_21517/m.9969 type:complete len:257 (+) Transcript_21517:6136-6906(+)
MVHETAIIDPAAELDTDVEVGPYSIVRGNVNIGKRTIIGPHVVIDSYTTIEPECKIFQYASVGAPPQAVRFKGEKTYVKIGRGSVLREFVTVNRGTDFGSGITEIGEENFLMAYSHVAHDCKTGKNTILSNSATLAGHVILGDYVTIGGLVAIHQFVHIGNYAFIGGCSAVVKDIPPYMLVSGNRATLHGLNIVGLKRNSFSDHTLSALKKAYRIIFRIGLTLNEAIERVKSEVDQTPEVIELMSFLKGSKRGITR